MPLYVTVEDGEVILDRCNKIPESIYNVFKDLDYELTMLHLRWQVYLMLFGKDKETVDLLNEFAPLPFRIFQDSLLDSVILSLSWLTDPRKSRSGYEYLSFQQLISAVDVGLYGKLKKKLKSRLRDVKKSCHNIREERHTRIAHKTAKLEYNDTKGVSRKNIHIALQESRVFLNIVPIYFEDTPKAYEFQFDAERECQMLLHYIDDLGKFYKEFGHNYLYMKEFNDKYGKH
ncbi:MAG: hypothetical protein P9L89_06895 [Candidatus Celaenobacter polaris]|nr:hypothetical protein [Candidatus Celaenobacter polaris]